MNDKNGTAAEESVGALLAKVKPERGGKNGKPAHFSKADAPLPDLEPLRPLEPEPPLFWGKAPAKKAEKVLSYIKCKDLILPPEDWNSRRVPTGKDGDPTKAPGKGEDPSDDFVLRREFEERIQRGVEPVHTPVKVFLNEDGKAILVWGFRRYRVLSSIDPNLKLPFTALDVPEGASPEEVDYIARLENLSENNQRKNLRPWEIAQACFDFKLRHPKVEDRLVAASVGKGVKYVQNLVRMRKNLCDELWESYRETGDMKLAQLIEVSKLPKDEQVEVYNDLTKQSRGGRPKGAKKNKGTDKHEETEALPIDSEDVEVWLELVERYAQSPDRERRAFGAGAHHALQVVAGKVDGFNPGGTYAEFRRAEKAAEAEE